MIEQDAKYPDPERHLSYGTAGFRAKADLLERAAFRIGLFVSIRAKFAGNMGVMVTASHNHHEDNGVKIIESNGSMLVQEWEMIAEMIINSHDLEKSLKTFNELQIKGFPMRVDIFGTQAIPEPDEKA